MVGSKNGLGSSTPPGATREVPLDVSENTGAVGLNEEAVATERQLCPLSPGLGLTEAS